MVSVQGESAYIADAGVQLMLRVRRGDEEAFESLFISYHPRVLRILTAMTRDQHLAEELAQEVFLRVHKARHRYRPTSSLITWLYRISRNLASNARRDHQTRGAFHIESDGRRTAFQGVIENTDGSSQFERQELRKGVREAVAMLSDRQRLAMQHFCFGEQSYIDIAGQMQVSTEAVKSLLSRARENLRIHLQSLVD